ncbi:SGNH/GDSL hydrolase family protein [Bacillus sp. JJ1533]|uniref:SGNH/GDSL hydrolase family protein n=1 Tax=Bacillus sp. JJ1533 TaxID=3122959 RepID=UPI002FFFD51E
MKKIIVTAVIILSLVAVVLGKLHWDDKIAASATSTSNEKTNIKVEPTNEESGKELKLKEIQGLAKNLPEDIQSKFSSAVENGKPLHLVIAGSSATPEEPAGWPSLLKEELEHTYGTDILKVTIKEIPDKTSSEVVQEGLYQEITDLSPDVLLFEPFILHDNGRVRFEERLVNITTILDDVRETLPNVSILLQPANPLHRAIYYPKEVEQFQQFAAENNYTYLNHWEAWPDHQTDAIAEFLLKGGTPNEKGQALWADYLVNYFISTPQSND